MTRQIRQMLPEDRPAIALILEDTPEFKPGEVGVALELIDAYLNDGIESGYYLLVALDEGNVAGYICYGETPLTEGTWDVYWIAVSRQMQGKGIGKALMSSAENEIGKMTGRLILIETSSTIEYEKTRRFYQNIGYIQICRIPDFYTPGDDKVILQKQLR